ncbi:5459_t:CDS:2 [Paraglomus brasilianum]|uniref:5459_t:CDS:1 n=1 Tax=Paraglomus brasilianum TaxID=144538 RepID=A0A9N8VHF2_9GLOM|nr:5459_t:CDS:2 [Paraglomus brasilianum]
MARLLSVYMGILPSSKQRSNFKGGPFSGPSNAGMRFMPPATRGTTR